MNPIWKYLIASAAATGGYMVLRWHWHKARQVIDDTFEDLSREDREQLIRESDNDYE